MSKLDYIDTRKATINALRDWHDKHFLLENAPDQIKEINSRIHAVKTVSTDSTPVQGGANKAEDNLCKAIDRKNALTQGYRKAKEYDRDITPVWDRLSDTERRMLTLRWIDYEEGNGIQKIMDEFHIEKSEAYDRSADALTRLSKLLFW